MKILWFSNKSLLMNSTDTRTGSWLDATAEGLIQTRHIELGNVTNGNVSQIEKNCSDGLEQWTVPSHNRHFTKNSFPYLQEIIRVVEEFSPDVIHVWGTEAAWGLLTARKYIEVPSVLDMQGFSAAIAKVYHGGLSISEQLACAGIKDILKGSMIFQEAKKFQKRGVIEEEIIKGQQFIIVQSDWIKAQVRKINRSCNLFDSTRLLRSPFYHAKKWQPPNNNIVFCSAAYPSPFKGLHVALRAISILKKSIPNIELRIAGTLQKPGLRQDGYIRWLNRLIDASDIHSNVVWLGGLNATEIIAEMLNSAVMVLPTFIENCSNTLQEAMMIGIPVVASYVGGLPSLARDEESILFFPPGDDIMCAYQISRIISDPILVKRISDYSRKIAQKRKDRQTISNNQIEIYNQVISATKNFKQHESMD
jgi:glycosyltransferase involved in cell wall biosynthesis